VGGETGVGLGGPADSPNRRKKHVLVTQPSQYAAKVAFEFNQPTKASLMKTPFLHQARRLFVIAVLPVVAATAAESPSLLLQKGIYAEEIEQNLDSAIKIYEQIAAEAANNRSVAAQAQYRLAVCYQKQGKKEQAIRLLHELVQQSLTDPSVTKKARDTLTELGVNPAEAVSIRRIALSGNPGWIVAVSSDGRFAALQPWDSNDLLVQDLNTGRVQLVDKDADMQGHSPPARFSPNGQWIAYDYQEAGIHAAKTDGSEVRKLFPAHQKDGKKHWNELVGWSADGTHAIMAQWDYTRNCRVAVALDLKTSTAKEIGAAPTDKSTAQWSISDDGRYVARRSGENPRTITLLDFKSGREETVLDGNARHVIGWADKHSRLVYAKDGDRRIEIYVAEVKDGKAIGTPKLLYTDITGVLSTRRSIPLGVTRDGRIFYEVGREKPQPAELWVMEGFLLKNEASRHEGGDTQTDISLAEIAGPNNSIADQKTGFSAILPNGWKFKGATRHGNGGTSIGIVPSQASDALVAFNYRPTNPWVEGPVRSGASAKVFGPRPPLPDEVDEWMRGYVQRHGQTRIDGRARDFQNDPKSLVSRTIGGHKALSWSGSYSKDEVKWVELYTLIYGESSFGLFRIHARAESIDALRAPFQELVDTIRFP
jgi:hypothetical protein